MNHPTIGVLPKVRRVNAFWHKSSKWRVHSSTDQFFAPRPSAMIPPVLFGVLSSSYSRWKEGIFVPSPNNKVEETLQRHPSPHSPFNLS